MSNITTKTEGQSKSKKLNPISSQALGYGDDTIKIFTREEMKEIREAKPEFYTQLPTRHYPFSVQYQMDNEMENYGDLVQNVTDHNQITEAIKTIRNLCSERELKEVKKAIQEMVVCTRDGHDHYSKPGSKWYQCSCGRRY